MNRKFLLSCAIVSGLSLNSYVATSTSKFDSANLKNGQKLYEKTNHGSAGMWCGTCHLSNMQGMSIYPALAGPKSEPNIDAAYVYEMLTAMKDKNAKIADLLKKFNSKRALSQPGPKKKELGQNLSMMKNLISGQLNKMKDSDLVDIAAYVAHKKKEIEGKGAKKAEEKKDVKKK